MLRSPDVMRMIIFINHVYILAVAVAPRRTPPASHPIASRSVLSPPSRPMSAPRAPLLFCAYLQEPASPLLVASLRSPCYAKKLRTLGASLCAGPRSAVFVSRLLLIQYFSSVIPHHITSRLIPSTVLRPSFCCRCRRSFI